MKESAKLHDDTRVQSRNICADRRIEAKRQNGVNSNLPLSSSASSRKAQARKEMHEIYRVLEKP